MFDNNYVLRTVKEDLLFLKKEWFQDIEDPNIRRSSSILRMLLVEGNLLKAWRLSGFEKEPTVIAPSLKLLMDGLPKRRIILLSAGGAAYKGMQIKGTEILDITLSDKKIKERYEKLKGGIERSFGLTDFMRSGCLLITKRYPQGIEQEIISRQELIQYISNKLGGVHLDLSRDIKKPREQKYLMLDWLFNQIQIGGKNIIYFELLSIGQSLLKSPDIEQLMLTLSNTI